MRTLIGWGLASALLAVPIGAQTLQEFSTVGTGAGHVTIFADGNVKDVVGEKAGATAASGSLGMTFRGATYIVTGLVNALSRNDTVTSGFGATLLPPATGRAFNSALVDVRRGSVLPAGRRVACASGSAGRLGRLCQVGLHGYLFASATTWATAVDSAGHATAAAEVPAWGSGVGGYFTFFDGWVGDSSRVGMALDVTWASRHLRGDFGAARADSLRRAMLRTSRRDFAGLETAINMRYNELTAALAYYYFGGHVPGFSGGQIVAAISVRARLNDGSYSATAPGDRNQ